jgi:N-acyl-D-aspartate/D-glutamate deacylase
VGVSTSRTYAHRFKDGRPAPSVNTEDEEVLALADGLAEAGTGVFQMVPDTLQPAEVQLDLLRRIAERSGRPVSFTFMQTPGHPGEWRTILAGLEEAKRDGLAIRGQILPRPTGGLLGLELSLHPFSLNPSFRPLESLPLAEKVRELRKPETRRRLLSESPTDPNPFFTYVVSEHDQLFVLGDPPNYHPDPADSIGARAQAVGVDPLELIYDALLERDGHEVLYRPMGNYEGDRFESVGRNMLHTDRTVIALGDGGAHYSMICDAAYTTYFLIYWMRDADPDKRVELPDAIRMLTREPAVAIGFLDRGVVGVGYKADLNVIDVDRLHLHAPRPAWDLPANGRRLRQRADGYKATVVSGSITYRDGEATGALPGRLVRGAQSGPRRLA